MILPITMAAALASEAPSEQFNLVCAGSRRMIVPSLLKDESEPYTLVYRIDLAAKKWCEGECKEPVDIVAVTPTSIVLEERSTDTPREHSTLRNFISRETGAHRRSSESGVGRDQMAFFYNGQCERAAFTGFPHVETKF